MELLFRCGGAVGIGEGLQRESAPELGQMMGRDHEMESPGVLTLTHWQMALPRALKECPDHSYPCTIHKTFEPLCHP